MTSLQERVEAVLAQLTSADKDEREYVVSLVLDAWEDDGVALGSAQFAQTVEQLVDGLSFLEDDSTRAIVCLRLARAVCDEPLDPETEQENDDELELKRADWRRLEQQFAVGRTGLAVLDEDEEWHPVRIVQQLTTSEADDMEIEIEFVEFGKKQVVALDAIVLDDDVADDSDQENARAVCAMCERPMNLTAHHLIPRTMHAKYAKKGYSSEFLNTCIMICRQCHSKIHSTEDEKTLAREYNTLETIMQHPDIIRYVGYARKQKTRIRPVKQSRRPVGK